jgi:hypothetical protein
VVVVGLAELKKSLPGLRFFEPTTGPRKQTARNFIAWASGVLRCRPAGADADQIGLQHGAHGGDGCDFCDCV